MAWANTVMFLTLLVLGESVGKKSQRELFELGGWEKGEPHDRLYAGLLRRTLVELGFDPRNNTVKDVQYKVVYWFIDMLLAVGWKYHISYLTPKSEECQVEFIEGFISGVHTREPPLCNQHEPLYLRLTPGRRRQRNNNSEDERKGVIPEKANPKGEGPKTTNPKDSNLKESVTGHKMPSEESAEKEEKVKKYHYKDWTLINPNI